MLEVVTTKNEILQTQKKFEKKLNKSKHEKGKIRVGFQGGHWDLDIAWSEDLAIWWGFDKADNRFWNAFGTEAPEMDSIYTHDITCEINPPFEGINRYSQGIFAKDEHKKYYLLHRGKIGGGRPGIGKELFMQEFRGKWVDVRDGNRITTVALVGSLESPRFDKQVSSFVQEVARIKAVRPEDIDSTPIVSASFDEEFSGTRLVRIERNEFEAKCDHGLVVKALANNLIERGLKVGNTQPVDLFVYETPNRIKIVFEIKTSASTTNYYGAIGQLLFHTAHLKTKPKLIAVFPETPEKSVLKIYKKIGISVLIYEWDTDVPVFKNLTRSIRS